MHHADLPYLGHLTPLMQILAGVALLLLGRKLFWLFVGVVGFVAGLRFGSQIAHDQPQVLLFAIAVGIGLLGAIFAIFLERIAIAVAGALAGGMFALKVAESLGLASGQNMELVAFVVGAVAAGILVSILFDWALVLLSSITGGALVSQSLGLAPSFQWLLFLVLFVIGLAVQGRFIRRPSREE